MAILQTKAKRGEMGADGGGSQQVRDQLWFTFCIDSQVSSAFITSCSAVPWRGFTLVQLVILMMLLFAGHHEDRCGKEDAGEKIIDQQEEKEKNKKKNKR